MIPSWVECTPESPRGGEGLLTAAPVGRDERIMVTGCVTMQQLPNCQALEREQLSIGVSIARDADAWAWALPGAPRNRKSSK